MRRFVKLPVKTDLEELTFVAWVNVDNVTSVEPYDNTYSIIRLGGFVYYIEFPMDDVVEHLLNDCD